MPRSTLLLLLLLLSPVVRAAVTEIAILETEVVVTVIPGAKIALSILEFGPDRSGSSLVDDTDGDGVIRVPRTFPSSGMSVFAADFYTGQSAYASTFATGAPQPLAPRTVLRGRSGEYTWILLPEPADLRMIEIVWVRPFVGAWRWSSAISSNYGFEGTRFFQTTEFEPLGDVAKPQGLARGDHLFVLSGLHPSTGTVDADLDAPPSGGVVSLPRQNIGGHYFEHLPAHTAVGRIGGSDGPARVEFEQSGGNAVEGVHFRLPPDVTFFTGELAWGVQFQMIDDAVYSGTTTLKYRLTNVQGMTLGDFTELSAVINDNDPPPLVTFAVPDEIEERDAPWTFPVTVRKSGATRVFATVDVRWSVRNATGTTRVFFAADEESKTIDLVIPANTTANDDSAISLTLANPIDARLPETPREDILLRDDDLPRLDIIDAGAQEAAGVANVRIEIDAPLQSRDVSVTWSTADGTAHAGTDYVAASGTVTARGGATIPITILNDDDFGPPETFYVDLVTASGASIRRARAAVTIDTGNGDFTRLRIEGTHIIEGTGASTVAAFPVRLSAAADTPVFFSYRTYNGSADAESDFEIADGTGVLQPGETVATILVNVTADSTVEANEETFTLALFDVSGALLERPTAEAKIVDDEGTRTIRPFITAPEAVVTAEGSEMVIPLALPEKNVQPVTVTFWTVPVTASANRDFVPAQGTITFPTFALSASIRIPIGDDLIGEGDETFQVMFSSESGTLQRSIVRCTIDDDETKIRRRTARH